MVKPKKSIRLAKYLAISELVLLTEHQEINVDKHQEINVREKKLSPLAFSCPILVGIFCTIWVGSYLFEQFEIRKLMDVGEKASLEKLRQLPDYTRSCEKSHVNGVFIS